MPAKSPDSFLENAINAYLTGKSIEDASETFHVSYGRLKSALVERGLLRTIEQRRTIKGAKLSARQMDMPVEEIAARYLAGESENAIARSLGVARGVIRLRLKQASIPLRDQTTANRLMMGKRTHEENSRNVQSAHKIIHGRKQSREERIARAKTRQLKQLGVSPAELLMQEWLKQRGINAIPQMAVGVYNVDLGTHAVAVEVFGGGWHGSGKRHANFPERARYLLNSGLNLVIIWVDIRKWPLREVAADYVASFIQQSRRDPTLRGQYRVIWGDGKEVPASQLNIDNLSIVPSRRAANNAGA